MKLRRLSRVIIFLVEDVQLRTYLLIFIIVVISLGWVYARLTPLGQGIIQNSQVPYNATFLQGLYFSVVTVSSLGYGDLSPIGISKLLACCEVLFGLAFMGIVIAKVTSRRLSYHVQRVFSSDAQNRLKDFALKFQASEQDIREVMKNLGKFYQGTPGQQTVSLKDTTIAASDFATSLVGLRDSSKALADYFSYEIEQGRYFGIVPADVIVDVGNSIDGGLFILGQLIISLSPDSRIELLAVQNRQCISNVVDSQKTVCRIMREYATDPDIIQCFNQIFNTCDTVLERYFAVPTEALETLQPDQSLQGADEPLEPVSRPKENMDDNE